MENHVFNVFFQVQADPAVVVATDRKQEGTYSIVGNDAEQGDSTPDIDINTEPYRYVECYIYLL